MTTTTTTPATTTTTTPHRLVLPDPRRADHPRGAAVAARRPREEPRPEPAAGEGSGQRGRGARPPGGDPGRPAPAAQPDLAATRWPDADRRTRIVFITQNMPRADLEEMVAAARPGRHPHRRGAPAGPGRARRRLKPPSEPDILPVMRSEVSRTIPEPFLELWPIRVARRPWRIENAWIGDGQGRVLGEARGQIRIGDERLAVDDEVRQPRFQRRVAGLPW